MHKEHHEDSDKIHLQGIDEESQNMIKKVKQALADGEGCRVFVLVALYYVCSHTCDSIPPAPTPGILFTLGLKYAATLANYTL